MKLRNNYLKGKMIMDAKKKRLMTVLMVMGFLFVGLVMIEGCKKSEPAPSETADHTHDHEGDDHAGHDHADHDHPETAMSTESGNAVVAAVEQTICPVMEGNPINKKYVTEYKGKKVYFCCPGCDKMFEANPEKYLAKLPQFNQPVEK
ncbi:MAG: YHS domain-containing protein [Planctomycetota bacterium]|jgi:YHS domain-containing protein